LAKDSRIEYSIEDSFTANFSTGTVGGRPAVVAIFADMGLVNAMSVPELIAETNEGAFDAIVHAGDVSSLIVSKRFQGAIGFKGSLEPLEVRNACNYTKPNTTKII